MKITNKYGIPYTLVSFARSDPYSKGPADYSVTELISPPRIQRLRRRHWHEMEQDVSDMLWQLLGSALHVVADRGQAEGHITEERLYASIDGITVSGAIDLQRKTANGLILYDYKFTSVWAVMKDKVEWEQQLNIYAWLARRSKNATVAGLNIVALIRDWNRRDAASKADYPPAPIHIVPITMWPDEKCEAYVKERISLHADSKVADAMDDDLPLCTPEDRWERPATWAVKKKGRKTALRVFSTEQEAIELAQKEKADVEYRKGTAIRCEFCGVSRWCSQYHQENAGGDEGSGVRPEGREE